MVSTLIKQIAKTWMHTLKSVQNKSIFLKGEARKKKEFKSGLKRTQKQVYALFLQWIGPSDPMDRTNQTLPRKQGFPELVWNGLFDWIENE